MSSITFPSALTEKEAAELKAHHLACSQLVRGCQDAIIRFRSQAGDVEKEGVSFRTIEIMESILDSWCETLAILRSALHRDSAHEEIFGGTAGVYAGFIAKDSAQMMTRFSKSAFASTAHENEHAARP